MSRGSAATRVLLKSIRQARRLSAAELASQVKVSRQTIYAIEDGSFVPNTTVALRLARVLGVSVEELFTLDEPSPGQTLRAELLTSRGSDVKEGLPVRLCRVNDRLIAAPAFGLSAYFQPAEGIVCGKPGRQVAVTEFQAPSRISRSLLLAGCDPALSVVNDVLNGSSIKIIALPCSSRRALEWLKQGRVHAAGSHLRDAHSGDYNVPFVRSLFPNKDARIVNFAVWEEGLVLRKGNPRGIRSVSDLAGGGAVVVNREKGSGSRELLDNSLRRAGISAKQVAGYRVTANGHLAAAYTVASGSADCCVATRSAARCFGLDFIPLSVERFDLSFSKAAFELPAAQVLLETLNSASLRRRLQTIAGYDTSRTGEVLM
jgi:putative molybdopterin biosynthesis protein